ncbi:MAG: UDP-3-O-acyl-N-acetylglucosamine deacetylase [Proteobacteria bacterium]|nr:UDP-3-O-acyl-N-acetylglucosamine deacetylase [Pseudomonadota bacterium]
MVQHCRQKTLANPVKCSGIGVHSGRNVNLTIKPAPVNHGIKFERVDLPDRPRINALFNMVVDTSLATVIGNQGAIVSTIEHLMASFSGLSIDNALVELDAYEMPIMDGSAFQFTRMLLEGGMVEQESPKSYFIVKKPIILEENEKSVKLYPSDIPKLTCTIEYNHPLIKTQTCSIELNADTFEKEICSARTFGFVQDIEMMKRYGLGRGGSLDNAVVIDTQTVLNDGGLRFPDEFVRHKLLDCIGDFSLLGMPILGHIVAFKSGHAFNHAFLKEFFARKDAWETLSSKDCQALNA